MENTKAELRVFTKNLRRNEELDPSTKHSLSEFLLAGERSGKSIQEIFNAGDLVVFDNHENVGLVLQVQPDSVKVLNMANKVQMVKLNQV